MLRQFLLGTILASSFVGTGCIRIKTDPIHVTVDVNIRVQKELDNFFDDLDSADSTIKNDKK